METYRHSNGPTTYNHILNRDGQHQRKECVQNPTQGLVAVQLEHSKVDIFSGKRGRQYTEIQHDAFVPSIWRHMYLLVDKILFPFCLTSLHKNGIEVSTYFSDQRAF